MKLKKKNRERKKFQRKVEQIYNILREEYERKGNVEHETAKVWETMQKVMVETTQEMVPDKEKRGRQMDDRGDSPKDG